MATTRIDGSKAAETLAEKLSLGDDIAAGLTVRTREDYARKIVQIATAVEAKTGRQMGPNELAEEVANRIDAGDISQSTARALKAAALFWVADAAQHLGEGRDLSAYAAAYRRIKELGTTHLPLRTSRTSGRKLKLFSAEAEAAVQEYAERTSRSIHAGATLAFVRANLLVGLRPSEWFDASLVSYLHLDPSGSRYMERSDANAALEFSPCLRVKNAKTGHGRANGEYREILLHGVSAEEVATIQHFLEIVAAYAASQLPETQESEVVKEFFRSLQNSLNLAVKRTLPEGSPLPTLYSTRHQAVADAKNSGLTDREIAALFGHSSTATAKKHYGRKLNGRRKTMFRPSAEALAGVPERSAVRERGMPQPEAVETARDWLKGVGD
ncbi:hypothetical protein NY96_19795 [Xanthomonas citri pv. fuscans]|uniref:site-specific integrase n=1 Tax=Xanthomonas TaxID=338 RepID=UPI00035E0778|nr:MULTISPECIES: site-specific integrase [Xanthomonas]KGT54026.1 hypothetical protein NY96_19795 [Xanthomonas citri pv. fuscans]